MPRVSHSNTLTFPSPQSPRQNGTTHHTGDHEDSTQMGVPAWSLSREFEPHIVGCTDDLKTDFSEKPKSENQLVSGTHWMLR